MRTDDDQEGGREERDLEWRISRVSDAEQNIIALHYICNDADDDLSHGL